MVAKFESKVNGPGVKRKSWEEERDYLLAEELAGRGPRTILTLLHAAKNAIAEKELLGSGPEFDIGEVKAVITEVEERIAHALQQGKNNARI